MLTYVAPITASGLLLLQPDIRESRDSWLKSLKPGTNVKTQMSRFYPKATNQQIKTVWGLLIETVKQELDAKGLDLGTLCPSLQGSIPPGYPVPREVLITLFYAMCNDVGPNGERKTLSRMNTMEAVKFFDNCRNLVASIPGWGIIVPDPDPNWRDKIKKENDNEQGSRT